MAFASGSVTFRRYRVVRCEQKTVDENLLAMLNQSAFGRYGSASPDDAEVGWITQRHLFDVNFSLDKIAVGRFAHFRMRLDRNTVPGSILRSYIEIEQAAALDASDREHLTKQERRQAKDAAMRRAEKEAQSGAFRRISAYPLILDLERGVLYFGNAGATVNDKMRVLFEDTFNAKLEPVNAHELAVGCANRAGRGRELADARPAHLIPPPDDADGEAYVPDPEDRGFLGREFLSWIWHHVETEEGMFAGPKGFELAASVTKLLQLKCDFNLGGSVVLRADAPASSPESRSALAVGKQPTKMGLLLAGAGGEWALILDGPTLDVSNLTLPPSEEPDVLSRLEERFEACVTLATAIDALYERFLSVRLSADWTKVLREMAQWAAGEKRGAAKAQPRLVSA